MEDGDINDPNIPHSFAIPVIQPATTNNTNNHVETAPTPNDMEISIQPATASGISATNN
jgi:hypothetical protein